MELLMKEELELTIDPCCSNCHWSTLNEPQDLKLALAELGCETLAEYASLLGLDAVNLDDPHDRKLVEQAAMDNARGLAIYLGNSAGN
jgi:hypothetical protein